MKFLRILVPVSGEETDKETIGLACKMAKEAKGKVYVVYVIKVKRSLPLDAEIETEVRKAEEILSHAGEVADEQDYDIETDLVQTREEGPAIVDEAMERNADLIVMSIAHRKRLGQFAPIIDEAMEQSVGVVLTGMGYHRSFGQFALTDTIFYVLKNAPCRVLLLRQPLR